jgi:hypothetical protein
VAGLIRFYYISLKFNRLPPRVAGVSSFAADLSVTAGAFRFNATDYYFPNFYEDAGYRGGVEVGGYYDDVFLPKEKKLRPFAEAGFAYSF